MNKGKIIVFGILFFYPLGGVTYQFLHYLLALRRLGYDPYYVEDSARWVYDPKLNDMSPDVTGNLEMVLPALRAHGFGESWCFRGNYPGGQCLGLSESRLKELYREAAAFLNVTGAQELRDEHRQIRRRIYVESDPFVAQIKVAKGDQGMIDLLAGHDCHFSFGENLGAADCPIPLARFKWLPTRQPVVLDLWQGAPAGGGTYNTITTWHNQGKDIEWLGSTYYWTKDREFEKFLDLPRRRPGLRFELAATVPSAVKEKLLAQGWQQTDSIALSRDATGYREYIQGARGEVTVARDQYVRPRTGWFSDRTACYLAAGRPVVTQETGFSKYLPSGRGLFGFTTMEDLVQAVDAIESDYRGHCQAAREVAAEYFDGEKVVGSLLERAGL
ncbi:MAG TPA: hypothetical protein VNU68_19280 [Verrucomicrobiae bacterium]|nr:hypothetical protein [Verrucomicrobiae bacterium]